MKNKLNYKTLLSEKDILNVSKGANSTGKIIEIQNHFLLFNKIRFVANAIHKNENSRYAINSILITKNQWVATDGDRLHILDTTFIPTIGLFRVKFNSNSLILLVRNEKLDKSFPKYDSVIPTEFDCCFECDNLLNANYGLHKKDFVINPNFLTPLFDGRLVGVFWNVKIPLRKTAPVLFDGGDIKAVILPINCEPIKYIDLKKNKK